jgi:uncharacterized protein (DUF2235 family)
MKRIVLCFDGTWNKPAEENLPATKQVETNVRRFFESVEETGPGGVQQAKWYDEGVGSKWYERHVGGAIGVGLEKNILDGYKLLAQVYDQNDEVYILGFSRGAYTARSLVGLIRNCGLVHNKQLALRIAMAYGIYRTRDDGPDSEAAKAFKSMFAREIKIKFLGVWDSVGALGIPLHLLEQFNMKFYQFHDTRLSMIVDNAFHALAIDEHREIFDACLWTPDSEPEQTLEQRWFIGAHCDVGGGYAERELSDIPLRWMQDKAAALGLALKPVAIGPENFRGEYHDSHTRFLGGVYAKKNARHYRAILGTKHGNEKMDESVERRRKEDPSYEPQNDGLPAIV